MILFITYVLIFLLSIWLTGLIRSYALSNKIIDIPNERSSHVLPTPRGGGIGFVSVFMLTLFMFYGSNKVSLNQAFVYGGAGSLVALLGFIDDKYSVSVKWRLIGHFIAAGYALFILGGLPSLSLGPWIIPSGMFLNISILFYLTWMLNLFNFMDGIDGMAASETIVVCLGASIIYYVNGQSDATYLPLSLAAAVAGFLLWNLSLAKIFMGDIGSCFLGIVMGLFSLEGLFLNENYFWSWLILLGVFIVDASLTLMRRIINGQKFWCAHRTHAYQHAAIHYGSHSSVTLRVLVITIIWLFPLAFLVAGAYVKPTIGLLLGYVPLTLLALKFKAGCSQVLEF